MRVAAEDYRLHTRLFKVGRIPVGFTESYPLR